MFTTSRPFPVFDHFRVPHRVGPQLRAGTVPAGTGVRWGQLTSSGSCGPALSWPVFDVGRSVPDRPARRFLLGELVLHGRLLPDEVLATALIGIGGRWARAEPLHAEDGA